MRYTEHRFPAAGGNVQLTADVFGPTGSSHETAILLLHGGGWRSGSRAAMHRYAEHLAGRGFTAIAVQYRLLDEAPWPAQRDDVDAAITWVRQEAQTLGVRPERIVVEGFSAGAHLALIAGGHQKDIAAIVAFFPATSFALEPTQPHETAAALLLGESASEARISEISPIDHVNPDYPPTFFLHGALDWLVRPEASKIMHDALTALGRTSDLHVIGGAHHEFSMESTMLAPTQDEVVAFIMRTVVLPRHHADVASNENPFAAGPEAFFASQAAGQRGAPE